MINENEVKIVNIYQVKKYLENGVHPLRLEIGYNNKIVFIYDKKESFPLFKMWSEHKFE